MNLCIKYYENAKHSGTRKMTFRLVFIRGERISTCNTRTSLRLDVAPLGHDRLDSLVKTTFSHPRFVFGYW